MRVHQKSKADSSAASSIGNVLQDANKHSIEPSGNFSNGALATGRLAPERKAIVTGPQKKDRETTVNEEFQLSDEQMKKDAAASSSNPFNHDIGGARVGSISFDNSQMSGENENH